MAASKMAAAAAALALRCDPEPSQMTMLPLCDATLQWQVMVSFAEHCLLILIFVFVFVFAPPPRPASLRLFPLPRLRFATVEVPCICVGSISSGKRKSRDRIPKTSLWTFPSFPPPPSPYQQCHRTGVAGRCRLS